MSMWYDPALAIKTLENRGVTEQLFKQWIDLFDHFKDGFELRRELFGLASLFRLNV